MKCRKLGNLEVSAVGLGCMGMTHAYGKPADVAEMRDLIAAALDAGCTLFDTAECYGTPENPHENEELVGAALVLDREHGYHVRLLADDSDKMQYQCIFSEMKDRA